MLETRIEVLTEAINNLTAALNGKNLHIVCAQYGENNHQIENAGTLNLGDTQKPTNPATPAGTTAPVVPTVPVAPAPTAPVANAAPAPIVPTSAPQYTLDMIATAGSALVDAGKMDQLMQLLSKFGVASLTELAPESYGAVANELRALGAKI